MGDLTAGDGSHLLCWEGYDRDGLAVEGHKLDFVAATDMHHHDGADVASCKAMLR